MTSKLLLGADPEMFVRQKGVNISAHGLVKGDKKRPLKVDKGAVQVDGTALEFNIDPASNQKEFMENIDRVLEQVVGMLPKDMELDFSPTVHYDDDYFKTIPNEALILGCEPDYDAYSGDQTEKPDGSTTMRTAAGHVHFGFTEGKSADDPVHFMDCRRLAAALDVYLGSWLSIIEPENDRKRLYGKSGCFRAKPYGMEYRSPSNYWLTSAKLRRLVYTQSKKAFKSLLNGTFDDIGKYELGNFRDYADMANNREYKKILRDLIISKKNHFNAEIVGMVANV